MRKLLLGSTALAAAASLGANAALADVSISGAFEWAYTSMSSNVTAKDGTSSATDSEIAFKFSNKTDSGLTVGWVVELEADDANTAINESSLSIAGGFGKVVLGGNDSVGDNFGIAGADIPGEEGGTGTVSSVTIGTNSDITPASGDSSKISYFLPAMGGLTMGVSHFTSVLGTTDSTEYGARYTMDAGGATITLGGASGTTEAATTDTDSQNVGVKIASGNITIAMGQGTYEAVGEDRETNDFGASYNMGNGLVVAAYTVDSEDSIDVGETFTRSGIELAYTIAPGLSAVINVDDFDYDAATSGGSINTTVSDNGTSSKLTIKASF
jgi:hypothetical protein